MTEKGFVHLHVHSDYSLLDGASKIDDLIDQTIQFDMPGLAITDHGNMFGAVEFYMKAKKAGIKPIIGYEAYVTTGRRDEKRVVRKDEYEPYYHLILLAENFTGYKNLMKLASYAYTEGFYYKPRIDYELLEKHHDGLIALSACIQGEIPRKILNNDFEGAKKAAARLNEIFGKGNFFIELQDHGIREEIRACEELIKLASKLQIPVVAANDSHYMRKEDYRVHDVLLCIQTGKRVVDENRLRFNTDQLYFKSEQEMRNLFNTVPESLSNTLLIAERIMLNIPTGQNLLPEFPLPPGFKTSEEYLENLCRKNLSTRYPDANEEVIKRMEYEIRVICEMKYSGYFLIVMDFIKAAKESNISVGPGRGSAAGSIVAYLLGITNLDPLKYDLIFERFLNPERVSMPDIDIDFADHRRGEVIDYVISKYGKENVCQIITFGKMKAKQAIRDVGRALDIPYGEVDKVAKMIPDDINITIEKALEIVPELTELIEKNSDYRDLLEISQKLEGVSRHASIHAAGVVITPEKVTEYVPLFMSTEDEITTQYDMKMLEIVGILKMDFLGLRTLTVIENTLKFLEQKGIFINLEEIPLDDSATFNLFSNGETICVFQFESTGMQEYLKKLKPERLEDLIAMNALYRPGPMNMIDEFIQRKHGKIAIDYIDKRLEPILKETYGILVYQEQVMRVANVLAGYSLGAADILRRAMGKKKKDVMIEEKERFVGGSVRHGVSRKKAEDIFNLVEKFAEYGFNKSHSTAYAYLAYQTAYLKVHYPKEFMAATISSEMNESKRVVKIFDECRRMGIKVFPPDINISSYDFTVVEQGIRFGLGAIKNVGRGAIENIIEMRNNGIKFKSLYDFMKGLDLRVVNKRVVESLISSGALDSLEGTRAQKMSIVDTCLDACQREQKAKNMGQVSLFGTEDTKIDIEIKLPEIPQWSLGELLKREREILGFYLSGHPLSDYSEELQMFTTVSIGEISTELHSEKEVVTGGIITDIKQKLDKNKKSMAFIGLEDLTGSIELLFFSDLYRQYKEILKVDALILVKGRVSPKEDVMKIVVQEVYEMDKTLDLLGGNLILELMEKDITKETVDELTSLLYKYPGRSDVFLRIFTNDKIHKLKTGHIKVHPNKELSKKLREIQGIYRVAWEKRDK